MDLAILLQMSGIINGYSTLYEANVPNTQVSYVKLVNGKLVKTKCYALRITVRGKRRNHVHRSMWMIYEIDIERLIRRISRHDQDLALRVKEISLTTKDVETLVRRATYKTLRLQLDTVPFYISGNGG